LDQHRNTPFDEVFDLHRSKVISAKHFWEASTKSESIHRYGVQLPP
jgi:hypothetical protein